MSKKKNNSGTYDPKHIFHNHLDRIGEVAVHYGFSPAKSPEIKKVDLDNAKTLLDGDFIENEYDHTRLPLHVEEKIALLRMYSEDNMHNHPQPIMFYFKEPFKGVPAALKKAGPFHRYCDLEIIGNSKSIAEATLIQTARVILKEEGYENISVDINSIGDKDSIAKFTRDLTAYYRKNINDMHTECRQLLKQDPFALLGCQNEKCMKVNVEAPKSISFLSETSRNHFKEILEYLEALGIPYTINNNLISNRKYCTETIFTINNLDHENKTGSKDHKILAVGVRYDGLAKKIGLKKEIQGAGISVLIKGNDPELRKSVEKTKRPWVSFVQLGFESKLLSLGVLELLRGAKVALYQSLAKDRLGAQVSVIEKNKIPYTIIMGQKEAMEKSVIVRNTETHAQDTVLLAELILYMKDLDKK
jgi:histidyl-tRNA synthetase